jgi:hypothetical protein
MFPFGETVVLHSRTLTGQDVLGNDIYTSADISYGGCAFSSGGSIELLQGQDLVTTQPTVCLPVGVTVKTTDRVTVRGDLYEVDGSPNADTNPFTGWQPGVIVKLQRVTG